MVNGPQPLLSAAERPSPVRSGSKIALGPVDSDSDSDGDGDDDESTSSSGSSSSGSSGSTSSGSSGSSSSSTTRSSSSSSASASSSDVDELGGTMGEDSYNSDSHHSEPIKLNPSSPKRSQRWGEEEEEEQVGSASAVVPDPPDAPEMADEVYDDDDDEGGGGGGDDTVVPGTEALQDAYWDPSSGHQTLSSAPMDEDDDDKSDDASSASSASFNGGSTSGDDDAPADKRGLSPVTRDGNAENAKEGSQSSSADSDQGVATMAYEVEEGTNLAERGRANGEAGVPSQTEGFDTDEELPVVMNPRQKQRRYDPPLESGAAAAADDLVADSKDPVDAMEAGQLQHPEQLLEYDEEPPDATYGEDVDEGNLEEFAATDNAKDGALRAAPTASFSRDEDLEADDRHPNLDKERGRKKRTYIVIGVVVLVAVAAIVGGVVGSQKGGTTPTEPASPNPNPPPPTRAPSPAPDVVISNQALFDMVANASADGGAAILQGGTPQNLAYASLEAAADQYQPSRWLQRYALRTFYYATNGPTDWVNRRGWNETDQDECLWHQTMVNGTAQGATSSACNQNHVLQALMLIGNNVTGTLPPELSLLTGLTRFHVVGQSGPFQGSLKGGIPSTLSTLTRLEEFGLGYHEFTEPIPVGLFDAWSAARLVEISESSLPGNFPRISKMTALRNLNFEGNELRGPFPADDLSQLRQLNLFNVDGNQLSGTLPPGSHIMYTSLGQLRVLSFAKNRLMGSIPAQLGSLTSLKYRLGLSSNSFIGTLPTELNLLTNLQRLAVSYNQLTGPVPDLSGLSSLTQLSLEGNKFSGSLSNGTCAIVVANSATASADCNRAAGTAPSNGTFACPCCTTCCVSTANSVCQT